MTEEAAVAMIHVKLDGLRAQPSTSRAGHDAAHDRPNRTIRVAQGESRAWS